MDKNPLSVQQPQQHSQVASLFHGPEERNLIKEVRDIMILDLNLEKKWASNKQI